MEKCLDGLTKHKTLVIITLEFCNKFVTIGDSFRRKDKMIRKMFKDTAVVVTSFAMVMGMGMPTMAAEPQDTVSPDSKAVAGTYNTIAVGGIDALIDAYIESSDAIEASETTEADTSDATPAVADDTQISNVNEKVPDVEYPEFENKLMADVSDYMNIRSEADAESEAVGKLPHGAVAEVIEKGDEWTKIQSGSVTGYVKNEYVVFGDDAGRYAEENCDKIAIVNTTTLKVREEADVESKCLTMIPEGEIYEVVETEEGWTKLLISEEFTGYVSDEFIDISFDLGKAISKEEEEAERARQEELERQAREQQQPPSAPSGGSEAPSAPEAPSGPVSGTRAEVVAYALQFVGNPYVYGGTSLTNGTDCSGFTMSVFAHFGYSLNRCSRDQIYNGTNIGIYEVQPGDLLFYNNGGSTIQHVALYIGDGKIVHASTPKTGIIVSNAYYQTPCGATRILP